MHWIGRHSASLARTSLLSLNIPRLLFKDHALWHLAIAVMVSAFLARDVPAAPPKAARLKALAGQTHLETARKSRATFSNPIEHREHFLELCLTTGHFTDPNGPEVSAPSEFRLLCYNKLRCGPTIRVRRGTILKIRLKNELKAVAPAPVGAPKDQQPSDVAEAPHKLSWTNLHTHGLHVSPADPADNIFLCIGPSEDVDFEFTIPLHHPAGTFWYHPHHHGSVAYQLSNGVAGALIVEGSPNDSIDDLEDIPEIAAAEEKILLLQLYNLRVQTDANQNPLPGKTAWIDADSIYNVQEDTRCSDAIALDADDFDNSKTTAFQATAINGTINPTMTIRPGEIQRWRMIHAAWDLDRHLTIVDDNGNPTDEFTVHEIALDGLATGRLTKKTYVEVAPGQRSDVLVQAPMLPPGVHERVYHLKQNAVDGANAPHSTSQSVLWLAKIKVTGPPHPMHPPTSASVAKCRPFADINDADITGKQQFAFAADDGSSTSAAYYTIGGKAFSKQNPLELPVETAQEWTLTASKDNHPFHIHVNPFQIIEYTDAQKHVTPMNSWRDTLYIKQDETYKIRTWFRDFAGNSVFHCHILDHEDQGMMMPLKFVKNGAPPPAQKICVDDQPQQLRIGTRPAPEMKLFDTRNIARDLGDFRKSNVVLVFFRGVECFHCAGQLRRLIRDVAAAKELDAEVVAVSGLAIVDGNEAMKALGASGFERFHLLVDADHHAFRDFGCYANGPLHGIFLLDRDDLIRASYVGESPFNDTNEVINRIRTFANPPVTTGSP